LRWQPRYEYADFEHNVVDGQRIDLVVSKVFIERRRIRLDLKRAVDKPPMLDNKKVVEELPRQRQRGPVGGKKAKRDKRR